MEKKLKTPFTIASPGKKKEIHRNKSIEWYIRLIYWNLKNKSEKKEDLNKWKDISYHS